MNVGETFSKALDYWYDSDEPDDSEAVEVYSRVADEGLEVASLFWAAHCWFPKVCDPGAFEGALLRLFFGLRDCDCGMCPKEITVAPEIVNRVAMWLFGYVEPDTACAANVPLGQRRIDVYRRMAVAAESARILAQKCIPPEPSSA